jgi:hypothetical protein
MTSDKPLPDRCGAQCRDGGYCENYPKGEADRCRMHGGGSPGAPEGNDNAVDVGAWAEDFYADFLTEAEKERVHESADALRDEATAQEVASHAASVCLEQFRRTGDERFMRRYESICDTFGLTPADEHHVEGELSLADVTVDFEDTDT